MDGKNERSAEVRPDVEEKDAPFDGAAFFLRCILSGILIIYLIAVVRISFEKKEGLPTRKTSSAAITMVGR